MTQELGAAQAAAQAIQQTYEQAVAQGGPQAPVPELITILSGRKAPGAQGG
jgi:hypothetical protein